MEIYLLILGSVLCLMTLLSLFSYKRVWVYRTVVVILFTISGFVMYKAYNNLLGIPKRVESSLISLYGVDALIWNATVEQTSYYLLLDSDLGIPVLYSIPYNEKREQQLYNAKKQARKNSTTVMVDKKKLQESVQADSKDIFGELLGQSRKKGDRKDAGEEDTEDMIKSPFHVPPTPPLPPKERN